MKGCRCQFNTSSMDCACCDMGACQCGKGNEHQCVQCGHPENCGTPLAAPDYGVDGFTLVFADCKCLFDESKSDCACCQNDGVQCGPTHKNQCVETGHLERCGSRPDIYGPPFPVGAVR
ncbi:hypothetical protein CHS0354_038960 [Potamilus streckersoni]|uniref:Uncharacterized protein n=1 Tax=Potamilus streckersoni TaxID=2493646 RepID=A0AAE0S140_9BIVA|nr:hypothetical protein CHS0354_038960 [Potamilus streckersoni]